MGSYVKQLKLHAKLPTVVALALDDSAKASFTLELDDTPDQVGVDTAAITGRFKDYTGAPVQTAFTMSLYTDVNGITLAQNPASPRGEISATPTKGTTLSLSSSKAVAVIETDANGEFDVDITLSSPKPGQLFAIVSEHSTGVQISRAPGALENIDSVNFQP